MCTKKRCSTREQRYFSEVGRKLPAVLVGDGEFLAGVATAGAEDAAAVCRSHAGAEAVLVNTLALRGLERSFHDISFLLFAKGTAKVVKDF
jgi:hypothetical protein